MGATLTTVSAGLKEIYQGRIVNQLQEEAVADKRIERTSDNVVDTVNGRYVTFPIRVKRNHGISYRGERGQIAPSGQQGYASVQVPLKYGYGRFTFTGQVMELADTNPQAFASMSAEEMDRLKSDLVKDRNRIVYGGLGGSNAVLARLTGTETSATHVVDNVQYLEVGMVVDVLVIASGSATGGIASTQTVPVTIDAIVESTKSVTFSASFGPSTTGHGVYRFGNRGLEPTGFAQIIKASTALHNVDPSTTPQWVSTVLTGTTPGTAEALSETRMVRACDESRRKGGKISAVFTSLGVRRAYFNLLTADRQFVQPQNFPGGFKGLPFSYGEDIPVIEDPDAPPNKMWFVDESKIRLYRSKEWSFADEDGNVLKWVREYDEWEGMMKCYYEYGTSHRSAHVLYDDITEA